MNEGEDGGKGTKSARETLSPRQKSLANLKPWAPGQSGNMKGRPKIEPRVRRYARKFDRAMCQTLAEIAMDKEVPPAERRRAAMDLIAVGSGRPALIQEIGGRGGEALPPLVNLSFNTGRPIDNAHDAASAYAYLIGNPGADISGLTFAAAEPAQAVPQPVEASAPVQSAAEPMPPDPTARPVDEEQQQLWARLAE